MRSTIGLIGLLALGAGSTPVQADMLEIRAALPAPTLAACMYRSLRSENPGQMKLTAMGSGGAQELTREMNGGGYNVFMWRADIRPAGKSASSLSVEVSRPLAGADTYEDEVRRSVQACAGG